MPRSSTPQRPAEDARPSLLRGVLFAGLPPRGRDWALMALSGLLATAIKGYNYGFNDQAAELPFVKYFVNPSLYPGDILFDSVRTKQPIFWRAVAVAAEVIPLPTLILILHVTATALTIIGMWALAAHLFRNRGSANLALVLTTLSIPLAYFPGLDPLRVVSPELVQRSFIFPWLLFALVLALHRRLLPALALVGLGINVHPMTAGVIGAMIFAGALIDPASRRRLPAAMLVAFACALPMFAGLLLRPGAAGASAAENQQWFELLRLRMGHHIFPSTWEASRWLGTLLVLAIGLRAHLAVGLAEQRHRTALAWFVAPLILWLPGYLFTEVRPVPLVAFMQLFRGTKFAMMIGLLYFAHHQVLRMSAGRARQTAVAWLALAVPVALWAVGLIAGAILALPHLLVGGPRRSPAPAERWPLRIGIAGLLLAMAGGGVMAISDRAEADWTNWWGGVAPEWYDVQVWVKEHSPIDTTVLVPPTTKGFRMFSERPIVGDLKDGGPHENNAGNMIEWWRRMQALGCRAEGPHDIVYEDFRSFTAGEIAVLGRRYDADLLVTYRDHRLPWEPIYANERWAVYRLDGPSPGEGPRDGGGASPDGE